MLLLADFAACWTLPAPAAAPLATGSPDRVTGSLGERANCPALHSTAAQQRASACLACEVQQEAMSAVQAALYRAILYAYTALHLGMLAVLAHVLRWAASAA